MASLIEVITEYRQSQGLTYEQLADRRVSTEPPLVSWNVMSAARRSRSCFNLHPRSVSNSLRFCPEQRPSRRQNGEGLAARQAARRQQATPPQREDLDRANGLNHDCIRNAIQGCYQTLDTIDFQLAAHNTPPMAKLVELANISSMIGNLLGGQIATCSNGLYARNRPHTYPDLLPIPPHTLNIEIKIALDTNRPKGHCQKPAPT